VIEMGECGPASGSRDGRQRFAVTQQDTTGIKTGSGFSTNFAMVEIGLD
jgi:hypothetical protein